MKIITTEELRELYEPVKKSNHRLSLNLVFHDFRKVDFESLCMHFDGAKLRGSDFSGTRFPSDVITSFFAADLSHTTFDGVQISDFDFDYANLSHASFRNARIVDTNFEKCTLHMTNFDNAVCINCKFEGSACPVGFYINPFKRFEGDLTDACFLHPRSQREWWDTKAHEIYVKFIQNNQMELANEVYQQWLDSDGEV